MKNAVWGLLALGLGVLSAWIAGVAWRNLFAGDGSLLEVGFYTILALVMFLAVAYDVRKALRRRTAGTRDESRALARR
jgi:hypothetical protein